MCTFCLLRIAASGNGNSEKYLESKHVSVPLPVFQKASDVNVYSDEIVLAAV